MRRCCQWVCFTLFVSISVTPLISRRAEAACFKVSYAEPLIGEIVPGFYPSVLPGCVIQWIAYDVQLTGGTIQNLDMLKVGFAGAFASVDDRAQTILARLSIAYDLRSFEPTARFGLSTSDGNPSIVLKGPWDGHCSPQGLLIMTVYPEDTKMYGPGLSQQSLARYLLALLEAHFAVFYKFPHKLPAVDSLEIVRSCREGAIFTYLFLQAMNYAEKMGQATLDVPSLKRSITMSSVDQRLRLNMLAHFIPRDWPE